MKEEMDKPLLQKAGTEEQKSEKKEGLFSRMKRNSFAAKSVSDGMDIVDSMACKSDLDRTPLAHLLTDCQAEPTREAISVS